MDIYIVDKTRKRSAMSRLDPFVLGRMVRRDISELFRDRYIIGYHVLSNLKVRYQQSFLGVLWSLLNPVLMLAVLAVVFSQILQRRTIDMTFYLFSGLIPWQFFSARVNEGGREFLRRSSILTKLRLNKLVFPIAGLVDGLVTFTMTLLALFILLVLIFGMPVHPQIVALPLCLAILAGFAFGLSLLLMVLVIYFRDLEHIISVVMRGWYFFTPILYPIDRIKNPQLLAALNLNPMTHIVHLFRCCLYKGQWPTLTEWLIPATIAFVMLIAGYATYKLREHDLIFRL